MPDAGHGFINPGIDVIAWGTGSRSTAPTMTGLKAVHQKCCLLVFIDDATGRPDAFAVQRIRNSL